MQVESDPDVDWVAALAGVSRARAEHAVAKAQAERRLFSHLAREHQREGRSSYVEIDAPLELYAIARLVRPRHVVEVGVSSGVSSAYLLAALEANGRGTLHSVDLPSRPRRLAKSVGGVSWSLPSGRSSGWAVPLPLRARWDLRIGDKARVVPLLAGELPSVELFVYDVPHDEAPATNEFRSLDPLVPPGGIAVVDHGPGGGLCRGLQAWASARRAEPLRRAGLGLYAMRASSPAVRRSRQGSF